MSVYLNIGHEFPEGRLLFFLCIFARNSSRFVEEISLIRREINALVIGQRPPRGGGTRMKNKCLEAHIRLKILHGLSFFFAFSRENQVYFWIRFHL